MEKTFKTSFGEVALRNAMFDVDGKNLVEGIEIKLDGEVIAEVYTYDSSARKPTTLVVGVSYNIEELTDAEVEEIAIPYLEL